MICDRVHSTKSANTRGIIVFTRQAIWRDTMNKQVFNATPPPLCTYGWATMIGRGLFVLAMLAVCAQAQAQNATGEPAVSYARELSAPNRNIAITASKGDIADTDGLPDPFVATWQWSQADSNGGTYTDITATRSNNANTATLTPRQDQVGKYLQVCATFMDMAATPNSETRCHRIDDAVTGFNNPPDNPMFTMGTGEGAPALTGALVEGMGIGLIPEGINDADGLSSLHNATYIWSADNGGDGIFTETSRLILSFTPDQKHVGNRIRCCITYTDDFGTVENFCLTTEGLVVNSNDAPVAQRSSVAVRADATSDEPYVFKPSDFRFADDDGDALVNIVIPSPHSGNAQGTGTLVLDGTGTLNDNNLPTTVTVAQLEAGDLTYYPTVSYRPVTDRYNLTGSFYAQFRFWVEDDGDDIRVDANGEEIETNVSAGPAIMNIRLADTNQVPAGGAPAITPSGASQLQHTVLTAAYDDGTNFIIFDRNGIDEGTVRWQWQQAAPVDGAAPPPTSSAWTNITGATDAAFALTQAQVGMHTRVRITFDDGLGESEGPLYSASITTADVADAPVAPGNTIPVAAGRSYDFSADDFPFSDEDGDALVHMQLVSLPDNGTLSLRRPATATAATLTSVPAAFTREEFEQLGEEGGIELVYVLAADATTPTANYDRFTYSVRTGTDAKDSNEAVITIALVSAMQSTATGMPTVTAVAGAAYDEDTELTASVDDITDGNGIDRRTLMWQWESAAAPANGNAPADSAYAVIAGAAAAAFTPRQAQVGRYIRVCLTFKDGIDTDEGPLCSAGARVANVNDAPMTEDSEVSVPTMTTEEMPHAFQKSDFPFADEDTGDSLQGITITDAPDKGALLVGGEALLTSGSSKNNVVSVSDISMLAYYPADGAEAGRNYDSFKFTVSDGTESSAPATMNIHLGGDLRLRLRIFLEGPLR